MAEDTHTKQKRKRAKRSSINDAEEAPKDPARITLADFLKNSSMSAGRPMKAAMEKEVRKKKKEDPGTATPTVTTAPRVTQSNAFCTPQVRVVGDQIVIDEQSVLLDAPASDPNAFGLITATEPTHITSASYSHRSASEKWTSEETDEFYDAIRRYGTDFTLLEKLFVKRSRKQLKSKFKREEKENPRRIDEALKNTIPIDIDHYHTAISQAAEKKKLLEERKEQATAQSHQESAKDDNSWETTTLSTTPQKPSNNIVEGITKEPQVDEYEVDEATAANYQYEAQSFNDNITYDDDDG